MLSGEQGGGQGGAAPSGGSDPEVHAALVDALSEGGRQHAIDIYRRAPPERRGAIASAIRDAFGAEDGQSIVDEAEEGAGQGAQEPEVEEAEEPVDPGDGPPEGDPGDDGGEDGGGGGGDLGGGEAALRCPPTQPIPTPPGDVGLSDLSTSDLVLIHEELIEHQQWSNARSRVGEPGSSERMDFILEQAGQGAITGGLQGMGMGFAAGAIGKYAARVVPIPGVGSILGGAMAVYGLATRDWGQTAETIGNFGQGDSGYEVLANTLASVGEIIDVITNIMNVVAGVLGVISAVMWIISIVTVGVASPLAGTLSAIALGIGAVSTIMDLINNFLLQPAVMLFRALHTFSSEADPRDVVNQGAGIADASGRAAGALGGWVGGKAGEAVGSRIGDWHVSRMNSSDAPGGGSRRSESGGEDGRPARDGADGPNRTAEGGPERVGDVDGPAARDNAASDVEVARRADAEAGDTRRRGAEALQENRRQLDRQVAEAGEARQRAIDDAGTRASESRLTEIDAQRRQAHQAIDADAQQRIQGVEATRAEVEMRARQTAHEHQMADRQAADQARRATTAEASRQREVSVAEADRSYQARQQAIGDQQMEHAMLDLRSRQAEQRALAQIQDPDLRVDMERQWAQQRTERRHQMEIDAATRLHEAAVQRAQQTEAAAARQREVVARADQARADAVASADQRAVDIQRDASAQIDRQVRSVETGADTQRAAADQRATSRAPEADVAARQAADAARPGADAAHGDSVRDATQQYREGQRGHRTQALRDGMDTARQGYQVQENYRPEFMRRMAGQEGTARHWVVDNLVWPFAEDLVGPFLVRPRMDLDAQGNPSTAHPDFNRWAWQGHPDIHAPIGRGGNAPRGNEGVGRGVVELGRALAGDSGEGDDTAARTQRSVDPRYEEPPGAPEQLDLILSQVEFLLEARAEAQAAEDYSAEQRAFHEGQQPDIDDCVTETSGAIDAASAHRDAVARREQANTEQQQRQEEAGSLIAGYPSRAAGFTALALPLAAFRTFTWIASKIPGGAGRAMMRIDADAARMQDAMLGMDQTMADEEENQEPAVEKLTADEEALNETADRSETSAADLETANDGGLALQNANEETTTEFGAAQEEARTQGAALEATTTARRAEHDDIKTQLTSWAQRHREARITAMTQGTPT